MFFSFPFQFYIGKEFFFILYDEIINKSLTTKLDELKSFTSQKDVITEAMLQKVRDDMYQIVRQPYMKYSKKKYYLISSLIYLPNFLLAMSFWAITASKFKEA